MITQFKMHEDITPTIYYININVTLKIRQNTAKFMI